jgi:PPOX class probable F420-dependent enzyme
MSEATFRDRTSRREPQATAFPGKYLSITSFRRDGTSVATAVWFVQEDGRLLVETDANSFKVKRIRRNPLVRVAPCTANGQLLAEAVTARAQLLPMSDVGRVHRLIGRKYRVDLVFLKPIRALQTVLRVGPTQGTPVIIAITLT